MKLSTCRKLGNAITITMTSHHVKKKRDQSPTKVRRLTADKLLCYTVHDGKGQTTIHLRMSLPHGHMGMGDILATNDHLLRYVTMSLPRVISDIPSCVMCNMRCAILYSKEGKNDLRYNESCCHRKSCNYEPLHSDHKHDNTYKPCKCESYSRAKCCLDPTYS